MAQDIYEHVAPYYDLLHADLGEDIGFVLTLAGRTGGPVLELGCGTGRLLLPLARAGYAVTGVDRSDSMLSRARERLQGVEPDVRARVQLVEGDMRSLNLADREYALALVPYNTLLHFDPAAAASACRLAAHHLVPDGLLFADLVNPHHAARTPDDQFVTLERTIVDPETGNVILVMASNRLDQSAQILTITWIYDATPGGNGPIHRTVAEMTYHYYYPHQIEMILQESGLEMTALYGDYNQAAFDEESKRMLVLARRKEGSIPS